MVTKTALITEVAANYPDNTTGAITPAILRATAIDGVNSWQQAPQVNQQTGTAYTVVVDDYGKMILLANISPVAISLPAAATTGFSPFNVLFKNNGSGTVTITPVTGTIDGAALLALTSGQSAWIVSDGTNWRTGILAIAAGGGGSSGISGGTANQVALFGSPTTITNGVTLAANQLIAGTTGAPAALTVAGDLTLSTGAFTIANAAVTYAKMQAVSAVSRLLGSSATTTAVQEITLGTNLSMSGTTLNAVGGGSTSPGGTTGQIQFNNGGVFSGFTMSGDATLNTAFGLLAIAANAVTYAKMQPVSVLSRLLGSSATTTAVQEITLGTNLSMSGSTLNAAAGSTALTLGTTTIAGAGNATGNLLSQAAGGLLSEITPAAGVVTFLTTPTSANLITAVTDETGTGALVFANTPTLVTPVLGVATATSINKVALTAPAANATLTIANGKTLTANNSLTLAGTDATTMTFPAVNGTVAALNIADQTVSGGANVTTLGLTTGSITIDCGSRPIQNITNNGAYTITAPANDGSCILIVTNGASAGATTFTGFTVGANTGDALTTTNTQKFTIFIWRANAVSGYRIAAHQ